MEKWKNRIWSWIHSEDRLPKKSQLLLLLLVGMLLLVIAIPVTPSGEKKESDTFQTETGETGAKQRSNWRHLSYYIE